MRWVALCAIALVASSAGAAKSVKHDRTSSLLDFTYEWPVKAGAIRGLASYLKADMEKAYRQARSGAAEDVQLARKNHFPFRQHSYSMSWDLEGETARLISL